MSRRQRWEARTEWPLAAVALLFLAAYAIPVAEPDISPSLRRACAATMAATWMTFGVDYAVRLWLASERWLFVRRNLLDLAVLVLPVLRPLRLLRLVAVISVLHRAGAQTLRGRVVTYAVGGTVLLVTAGALAITDAERGQPGASIANLGDGFWWAVATVTTVGYGDIYPVTTTGRFVAVALMVGGIALLGVVTATLASWMTDRVAESDAEQEAATRAQVQNLSDEVHALRRALEERAGAAGEPVEAGSAREPAARRG